MEKLNFDTGIREFEINGCGVLRFNPADPNVYARLMEAGEKIKAAEADLVAKASETKEADGGAVLQLLADADRQIKEVLRWVFGPENDFDQILGGVNLLGIGANGERVITNFLAALTPVIQAGAEDCARRQVSGAVAQARLNRAQRRAAAKK